MKENKILKLLLVSVVFGLGACNSQNANSVPNSINSNSNTPTKEYKVTWVIDDKTFIETYKEGETPVYKFGTAKEADKTYTYTFSGWDKLIKPVTEDVTYTAQYLKEYIDYTYTWVIDGEEQTETYHYGDEVTYKGETPTKEGTDEYSYIFTGWSKEVNTVTGNEVNEAQFERVFNTYDVTFIVEGVETTETYYYGEIPEYEGVPTKESDNNYSYTFIGWDEKISPVTKDVTYTAIFDKKELGRYNVNFYDYLGNILYTSSVKEGDIPTYEGNIPLVKDSQNNEYDFVGWLNRDTNTPYIGELSPVTGDTNYYAYSNELGILTINSFENGQKTVYTQEIMNNESYSYTIPNKTGLVPTLDYVKGSMNLSATFDVYYTECDKWNGSSTSSSYSGGTGTSTDPYLISSAADLSYLKQQVDSGNAYNNTYFKMTKSVDMNNSNFMIGSFAGNFDGNYCTIRGLNISNNAEGTGLFKSLLINGTIDNVTTYGNIRGVGKTGSIAGESHGIVSNCTNYATITANGQKGGIIGYAYAPIINCTNNGDIKTNTSGWNVGGIAGQTIDSIINCVNNGNVEGATSVGGIFGESIDGTTISIDKCINNGKVSGTWGVGGISGNPYGGILNNCYNYGKVSGTGQVGGMTGKGKGTISSCYNYGDIDSQTATGGIAGQTENGYILKCVNYGHITGYASGSNKGDRTAGIVGQFNGIEINGCINNGTITCTNTSGGIIGKTWNSNRATITNCVNNGTIYASSWLVGGIFGTADVCNITKCTNNGDIINTTDSTGGIGGAIYENAYVEDCHNTGNITSKSIVGGLLSTNRGTIKNCTNSGDITITTESGTASGTIFTDTSENSSNCTSTGQIIKA